MENCRPERALTDRETFKQASLELLAQQLASHPYPNYPKNGDRLWTDELTPMMEPLVLPVGAWETSGGELPTLCEHQRLHDLRLRVDAYGRPLHPWFHEMLTDPNIGVVTGKGFYREWGPNYTADPIVIRHDLGEPRLLLIKRGDTGMWALPGGFIDPGENALTAALREASEETRRAGEQEPTIPLADLNPVVTAVYQGPLADVRVTANAWPETTAFRFDLSDEAAHNLPVGPYEVKEDEENGATMAGWFPLDSLDTQLFGSHSLLVKLALGKEFGM